MENTISYSPDQEILGYLNATFTKECQADLVTALSILYSAEFPSIQETLANLLYGQNSENPEVLSAEISATISESVESLLEAQGIKLNEDTPLSLKNTIATTLMLVVAVEDPVPYLRILETDLSPIEKLSRIVESICMVNEIAVLDAVEVVSEETLSRLYDALEKQEARQTTPEEMVDVTKQLNHFKKFCEYVGKDHIGYAMLTNNFKFGLPARSYYPYVSEHLVSVENEVTAKNLLSYYLLGSDTWESPITAYRQDSEVLVPRPVDILPIETLMRKTIEGLEQFKGAHNE